MSQCSSWGNGFISTTDIVNNEYRVCFLNQSVMGGLNTLTTSVGHGTLRLLTSIFQACVGPWGGR